MDILSMANGQRIGRAVLVTSTAVAVVAMGADLWINSISSASLIRSTVYLGVAVFSAFQMRSPTKTYLLTVYLGAMIGILSIVDSIYGTTYSLLDPGSTLAFVILVAVTFVALRDYESPRPVVVYSVSIAVFSVLTVLLTDMAPSHAIGFLVAGVAGQALVLWIIFQLITSLARASETDAKHARIQTALAECSQALLNRGTPDPLNTALRALLDATEAAYAYIDVNRADESGRITWEIVAEAEGDGYPEQDPSFTSGSYEQLSDIEAALQRGDPAEIIVADLPMPIRARYESEGIKAELVAPIHIGDRWVGSLGYTDHLRAGTWSSIEVEGLRRAAEMVAAYWEREAAREGLMELAQAKDRFIAAVSHELRTPLAAVVGFAGELAGGVEGYSRDDVAEITQMIYTQGLELTHLVDDLLTSERAASGNLTIRADDIDLLEECRDIITSIVVDKTVAVEGVAVRARADSLRTRQIVRNLLTNAARYGGDTVVLEVTSDGDTATVTVRDDGPGVGHLDVDRIFDHYYRSQGQGSAPDSVGLGLAVARQLARLMDGDIVYRRTAGWTRFELTLPVAAAPAEDDDDILDQFTNDGSPSDPTLSSQPILS